MADQAAPDFEIDANRGASSRQTGEAGASNLPNRSERIAVALMILIAIVGFIAVASVPGSGI